MQRKIIPYNFKLKKLAKKLRNNSTLPEILLWNQIKGKQIKGYSFHRQKMISSYIVDFYCSELMLVIEVDGTSHLGMEKLDDIRQKEIEEQGVSFLRFTNSDVKGNMQGVVQKIIHWIDDFEAKQ